MSTQTAIDFARLLDTLGLTGGEFVSLIYWDTDDKPHTAVMRPADAIAAAAKLPDTVNAFFGVNPTCGPARKGKGRGKEADITRLATLVADLDLKPGGCPDRDVALAIIAEIGCILGTRASVIVDSGHGLHAYWPISDGHITNGDIAAARALLKRFGRLVAHVAAGHNVHVDNVFDLARVMRLPGSHNNKSTGNGQAPILVTAVLEPGGPLSMAEVDERLTEHGVDERDDDRAAATTSTHNGEHPRSARTPEEIEAYTQSGIDKILDLVEADPEGERNHNLKDHASRCFRLALLGGFDLDDVYDELFAAARIAGATANPHTDSQIRATLRGSRTYAIAHGPAPPPRDLVNVTEVDELRTP